MVGSAVMTPEQDVGWLLVRIKLASQRAKGPVTLALASQGPQSLSPSKRSYHGQATAAKPSPMLPEEDECAGPACHDGSSINLQICDKDQNRRVATAFRFCPPASWLQATAELGSQQRRPTWSAAALDSSLPRLLITSTQAVWTAGPASRCGRRTLRHRRSPRLCGPTPCAQADVPASEPRVWPPSRRTW